MKLIINNTDLTEYGVMVEHFPTEVHAGRKIDTVSIPGRNGDLIFSQDAFNNVTESIDIAVKPCGGRTRDENISKLCDILLSSKGFLRIECDGWAKFNGEIYSGSVVTPVHWIFRICSVNTAGQL